MGRHRAGARPRGADRLSAIAGHPTIDVLSFVKSGDAS